MQDWKHQYQRSLIWTLNHRWKVLLGSILFVAASFFSVKFINKELSPVQDQSLFIARLMMPVGTSLSYTSQQAQKAEETPGI